MRVKDIIVNVVTPATAYLDHWSCFDALAYRSISCSYAYCRHVHATIVIKTGLLAEHMGGLGAGVG